MSNLVQRFEAGTGFLLSPDDEKLIFLRDDQAELEDIKFQVELHPALLRVSYKKPVTLFPDYPHDVVYDVKLILCGLNWLKPLVNTMGINLTGKLCGLYFLELLVVGEVVFECFEVVYLPFHLVQTILYMLGDFFSESLF